MLRMPTGLYISVPFCGSKCSYCNFASGVFSRELMARYVARACAEMRQAKDTVAKLGGEFDRRADSVYLGGGTPTALEPEQLQQLLLTARTEFEVVPGAEVTVEVAPGSLSPEMLETLVGFGVNRVSLGVQSFVDKESAAVGRLHTRAQVLEDISRLRSVGLGNFNIDLIAGLPHQTAESWAFSLNETLAVVPPHISVYMLEVDEDSRLGRELIAGGTRYHAHSVPNDDLVAELYETACQKLGRAGFEQYEISNFAWKHAESKHNLKYWEREPYLGFGLDAHSMVHASSDSYDVLRAAEEKPERPAGTAPCAVVAADYDAVRFANPDSLDAYLAGDAPVHSYVSRAQALEESLFLGLRLTKGVDLHQLAQRFGEQSVRDLFPTLRDFSAKGLVEIAGRWLRLTDRGRLLSNEVFQGFLQEEVEA